MTFPIPAIPTDHLPTVAPSEAAPDTEAQAFLLLLQNAGLALSVPIVSAAGQPIQPEPGAQQPETDPQLAADAILWQAGPAMDSISAAAALLLQGGASEPAGGMDGLDGMMRTDQAARGVGSASLLTSGSLTAEALTVQGHGSESTAGENRVEEPPHADQKPSIAGPTAKPSHQQTEATSVIPASHEPPSFTTHALVKTEEVHLRSVETKAATSPAQSAAGRTEGSADADAGRATDIATIATLHNEQVGQLETEGAVSPDEGQAKESTLRPEEPGAHAMLAVDQPRGRGETAAARVSAAVPVRDVPDEPHQPGQPASLRLEVQQADMGRVRLHVTVSDHAVYANVLTERPDVQELLARQQPRLESGLQGHGLSIGGFHVGLQEHGRGRADLGWTSSGHSDGTRRDEADVGAVGGVEDTERLALAGDRRLNLFV